MQNFRVLRLHDMQGTRILERRDPSTGYWGFCAYLSPIPWHPA